jgi:hypothetical protein
MTPAGAAVWHFSQCPRQITQPTQRTASCAAGRAVSVVVVNIFMWMMCSLPATVLLGYCAPRED